MRRVRCAVVGPVVLVALLASACSSDEPAGPTEVAEVLDGVAIDGIAEHLSAFADIAAASGGDRAAGTPGFDASSDYVEERLSAAGYRVSRQSFEVPYFEVTEPAVLRVGNERFVEERDLMTMVYSAEGSIDAVLQLLDFKRDAAGRNGPGCDPDAFADIAPGSIVLLRPGPCLFRDQVINAQGAGAGAVVFSFPEYERGKVLRPTLISPRAIDIPVVAASDPAGKALVGLSGEPTRLDVATLTEQRKTENVIAESAGGSSGRVVMAGGHLDSVIDGPGINDNGSGIATLIEVAEEMVDLEVKHQVRFAFWSGEELGLLGSTHYVDALTASERDRIALYLNFDMLGSSNHVRYVYADADAPEGSEAITELFLDYFRDLGLPTKQLDLEGRSDHGPFLRVGIPVGGLFSGADMIKSASEVETFGGTRGEWEDPCYHRACDDLDNVDLGFLATMAGAVEAALVTYATAEALL